MALLLGKCLPCWLDKFALFQSRKITIITIAKICLQNFQLLTVAFGYCLRRWLVFNQVCTGGGMNCVRKLKCDVMSSFLGGELVIWIELCYIVLLSLVNFSN